MSEVDESKPNSKLQIRLADGTRCALLHSDIVVLSRYRLVGKFNNDQSVADVRRFIDSFDCPLCMVLRRVDALAGRKLGRGRMC